MLAQTNGPNLPCCQVNCDANEDLCREDRWDLAGYPAVKVVRGNTVHDYIGPWNARNIAAFMRQVAAFDPDDESTDEEDDELEVQPPRLIRTGSYSTRIMLPTLSFEL